MCESFNPGMTVRRPPSMTRVAGPRRRKISSLRPVAVILPPEIAIASTNEGRPFVAILALCNMISADTRISWFVFQRLWEGRKQVPPASLFVSSNPSGNCVLGKFRSWRTVHHRVGVLSTYPVSSVVALHNVHHGIVSFLVSPVALPLQHGGE